MRGKDDEGRLKLRHVGITPRVCGEKLAEKAGISEGQFCQKLAGNFAFRQDEIDRICALLSISPADIGRYFFLPKKL